MLLRPESAPFVLSVVNRLLENTSSQFTQWIALSTERTFPSVSAGYLMQARTDTGLHR